MNRLNLVLGSAAVLTGLAMSGMAEAATVSRLQFNHGTGFCQAALPNYEGNMRKRPMAIANEGTSNSFVTCSKDGELGTADITEATLKIFNRNAAAVMVTCTLVHGFQSSQPPTFIPKTLSVPAGGSTFFPWLPADNAGVNYQWLNWSCELPPGIDIGYGYIRFNEEIGT